MKATGIVRRIDDLGRIVIPKEIRRTMRIREEDPLEIFTNKDGEVIFKKYSPIGELTEHVDAFAQTLSHATGATVAIVDKDTVVAASGAERRQLMDKKITLETERLMEERGTYTYKIGATRIPVVDNGENCNAGIICPLLVEGDVLGAVIMLIKPTGAAPTEMDIKVIETTTQLLAKELES